MKNETHQEVLQALPLPLSSLYVETIRGGLINHSYKVTDKTSGQSWFLQQINRNVFQDPVAVQQNLLSISHHLDHTPLPFRLPKPVLFPDDRPCFIDSLGEYWRMTEYITSSLTLQQPEKPGQAADVAASFAHFTKALASMDPVKLSPTLPGFHDLGWRYRQFSTALQHPAAGRAEQCRDLVAQMQDRTRYVTLFETIRQSDQFPIRLMHHDAKISNVLFDAEGLSIKAIVDLDTVMPGYFFSDLGDMVRSMAGSIPEDGPAQERVLLNPEYYEAVMDAYRGALGPLLTATEHKYLHYAGILMIYMQCLRFLTDFLLGDPYYQCSYPGQNLQRTKNQLALLQALEAYLDRQQYLPND